MTINQWLLVIFGIGSLFSIIFTIAAAAKGAKEAAFSGMIMFFTQPIGFAYFAGQFIAGKMLKMGDIDTAGLSFSKKRREKMALPDMENEMQSVPLEEAFLVSSNADKRKRLLFELKKDHIKSYKAIAKAFDFGDSESSLYAASAISGIKARYEIEIRKYENMRDRPPAAHARAYADHLASFLDSGILDAPDARRYSYLYLNLMALVEDADFFNNDDFAKIVDCALFVGDYILAENWAKKSAQTASEQGYLNLLKVYYATNRSRQFFDTLSALKKSDLPLSPEGLELVQFFT